MLMRTLQPPLSPRNRMILVVLIVCRISTSKQDEKSLDDQEAFCRQWLAHNYDGPVEVVVVASEGSGECLDSAAALQIGAYVESRRFDLVLSEDLARISRRINSVTFCEACEDAGTRVITINDHIDTGTDDWRLHSFFAAVRHEAYNKDTSRRIRRSHRNRFMQGGICQTFPYGYIKPAGAKSDAEVSKDPAAIPVYERWAEMLEAGASFAEVADWLNADHIPVGNWVRQKSWDGSLVGQVTRNTILKGVRSRNNRMSQRVNRTGRHRSVKAPPEDLLERSCPHLAFWTPERFDRINALLRLRNAKYRRRLVDDVDPRANVPKKRTRWPGQHLICGQCGAMLLYGAHGQTSHLMCGKARDYRCWMGVSVDGAVARRKLITALGNLLDALPEFDPAMVAVLQLNGT